MTKTEFSRSFFAYLISRETNYYLSLSKDLLRNFSCLEVYSNFARQYFNIGSNFSLLKMFFVDFKIKTSLV